MLLDNPYKSEVKTTVDKSKLTVKDILDFADQIAYGRCAADH